MARFEGVVEKISYRNDENGFTVAQVKLEGGERLAAVGAMPMLLAGERAAFEGELVEHREYGRQIRVSWVESIRPESLDGIEKYLASGMIRGVGPATARLIVESFGPRTLDVLESEPQRLTEVPGIGEKRAAMIAASFLEHNQMRGAMMFLQKYGLTPAMAARVYRAYGERTESVARENPYRLADEVEGVGFKTADRMALAMGFSLSSEFRLQSGLRYALNEAANASGHMYLPLTILVERARQMLGADEDLIDNALRALILSGGLEAEDIDGETAVYLPWYHEAETDAAFRLTRLLRSFEGGGEAGLAERAVAEVEEEEAMRLCAEQREAVEAVEREGVLIITGGPGTGKTTTLKCILRLLDELGGAELCAPTGRAAKRMSEATGRPARTIHRLLEYAGEEGRFLRNEQEPLDCAAVVVDEMSMVDIFLFRALLRALRPGTRLVMVGDKDQLPSVGAGNVLKDMLESGAVPSVTLTEVFRQAASSMIVRNAHRINRGEYPEVRTRDTDFFLERRESMRAAVDSVVQLVTTRLPRYLGVDPLRGIQVMAPMKRMDAGVYALNAVLQQAINPPAPGKARAAPRRDGLPRGRQGHAGQEQLRHGLDARHGARPGRVQRRHWLRRRRRPPRRGIDRGLRRWPRGALRARRPRGIGIGLLHERAQEPGQRVRLRGVAPRQRPAPFDDPQPPLPPLPAPAAWWWWSAARPACAPWWTTTTSTAASALWTGALRRG